MFIGMTTFKCDACGHKFTGMAFEWCCTIFTAPVKCPECGSWHTAPLHQDKVLDSIYRDIWKSIDDRITAEHHSCSGHK